MADYSDNRRQFWEDQRDWYNDALKEFVDGITFSGGDVFKSPHCSVCGVQVGDQDKHIEYHRAWFVETYHYKEFMGPGLDNRRKKR